MSTRTGSLTVPLVMASLLAPLVLHSTAAGLTVGRGGVLLKDGAPYRGIGVNYFDAFYRTLKNNNDTSYRTGRRSSPRSALRRREASATRSHTTLRPRQ